MKKFIIMIILMALVPSIGFLATGLNGIIKQHYQITHYEPVEATVLSSRVKHTRNRHSNGVEDIYRPEVEYSYVIDGKTYKSNRVAIFKTHKGYYWARSVVGEYPEGKIVTAFYDPDYPSKSFLVERYLFLEAYGCVLWSVPCWIVILLVWRYYFGFSFKQLIPRETEGSSWYELPAYLRITDKLKTTLWAIGVCVVIIIPTLGHYFWVADPPYDTDAIYHAYACAVFFLIPLGYLLHYLFILRYVGEARIFTLGEKFYIGNNIEFRLSQRFHSRRIAEKMLLEFVCEKRVAVFRTKRKWYQKQTFETVERLHEEHFTLGNEVATPVVPEVNINSKCVIPSDLVASTDPNSISFNVPRYYWFFNVTVPLLLWVRYKAKFPIQIKAN